MQAPIHQALGPVSPSLSVRRYGASLLSAASIASGALDPGIDPTRCARRPIAASLPNALPPTRAPWAEAHVASSTNGERKCGTNCGPQSDVAIIDKSVSAARVQALVDGGEPGVGARVTGIRRRARQVDADQHRGRARRGLREQARRCGVTA